MSRWDLEKDAAPRYLGLRPAWPLSRLLGSLFLASGATLKTYLVRPYCSISISKVNYKVEYGTRFELVSLVLQTST